MAATSKKSKPSGWRCTSSTADLVIRRLYESGLSEEDGLALGLYATDMATMVSSGYDPRPALVLPYLNPIDGSPLTPQPGFPEFHRIRYLGEPPAGFAALSDKKPRRYSQPSNTGVCAYFPLNIGIDWELTIRDPAYAIVITEGELKAASGCAHGWATLGLGGVWSWRSVAQGLAFLPELEIVNWVGRHVYLVFDSDIRENTMVAKALQALAEQLYLRGAMPMLAVLPELEDGKKTGLDDFLVSLGADAFESILGSAQHLTLARSLFELSKEVVYVRDPGLIIVRETGQKITPTAFTGHAYSAKVYNELVVTEKGDMKLQPAKAAQAWLSWPLRAELGRMTYSPGQGLEVEENGVSSFNLWRGWGCESRKGDITVFTEMVERLFLGATAQAVTWFLDWLAYPIQFPGTKMNSSVVLWSPIQGVGKSLIGYTMKRLYGANFAEISQTDLESAFTEWAENKQFVMGDEVTGSNKRSHADMLKKFITQEDMRINVKMVPSYSVPDRINYLFTSNSPDAFFMDDRDRRYFVHEVICEPPGDEVFDAYFDWLDNQGGKEALFYWLQHRKIKDFKPKAPALRTAAKERMIEDGRSDLGAWVSALREDPEAVLRLGEIPLKGDLFTSKELMDLYDPMRRTGVTINGLAREIRRAGFGIVCEGAVFRAADGRLERFYVCRGEWVDATRKTVEAHLAERYGLAPKDLHAIKGVKKRKF